MSSRQFASIRTPNGLLDLSVCSNADNSDIHTFFVTICILVPCHWKRAAFCLTSLIRSSFRCCCERHLSTFILIRALISQLDLENGSSNNFFEQLFWTTSHFQKLFIKVVQTWTTFPKSCPRKLSKLEQLFQKVVQESCSSLNNLFRSCSSKLFKKVVRKSCSNSEKLFKLTEAVQERLTPSDDIWALLFWFAP